MSTCRFSLLAVRIPVQQACCCGLMFAGTLSRGKRKKKEQALSDVIAVICVISHFLGFVSLMSPGETCRASPSCRVEMVAADPATAVAT